MTCRANQPGLSGVAANLLQPSGLMVADQLSQRWLIELLQDLAELVRIGASISEIRAVSLPQGADQRVAVLAVISPFLS
jgi:hypothetical protein